MFSPRIWTLLYSLGFFCLFFDVEIKKPNTWLGSNWGLWEHFSTHSIYLDPNAMTKTKNLFPVASRTTSSLHLLTWISNFSLNSFTLVTTSCFIFISHCGNALYFWLNKWYVFIIKKMSNMLKYEVVGEQNRMES